MRGVPSCRRTSPHGRSTPTAAHRADFPRCHGECARRGAVRRRAHGAHLAHRPQRQIPRPRRGGRHARCGRCDARCLRHHPLGAAAGRCAGSRRALAAAYRRAGGKAAVRGCQRAQPGDQDRARRPPRHRRLHAGGRRHPRPATRHVPARRGAAAFRRGRAGCDPAGDRALPHQDRGRDGRRRLRAQDVLRWHQQGRCRPRRRAAACRRAPRHRRCVEGGNGRAHARSLPALSAAHPRHDAQGLSLGRRDAGNLGLPRPGRCGRSRDLSGPRRRLRHHCRGCGGRWQVLHRAVAAP